MSRPRVIGITLRPQPAGAGRPARLVQNRAYFEAIEGAGAVPLPLPLIADLDRVRVLYERCDAVCLPGGPDVHPEVYGEEVREDCALDEPQHDLDSVEMAVTRWATAEDLPVLAVCRGVQVLNVALGGTLWQDLNTQAVTARMHRQEPRDSIAHSVEVVPGTLLHRVVDADRIDVNSLHHQAVRELGEGLVIGGRSDDGVVEAVELPDRRFLLGVQWHPEELVGAHASARRLFDALVAAAR